MPRLVRRKPLAERLKAYLNPLDFLLYLSEELETSDWDTAAFGRTLGLALNFTLLVARANSARRPTNEDDVFGDGGGSSWAGWLARFLVTILTLLSLTNAAYTFLRKRHYRLFEAPISAAPSTPNATRVRVSSSPSSSPLRLLTHLLPSPPTARAHPSPTQDVWELSVWDPLPLSLQLYTLFSPGHVLVYFLLLPIRASDPRPSLTVATALLLQALLSTQMVLLQTNFEQQAKDTKVIHKEVMNEYDTKFVHPLLHPQVRDVGTQISTSPASTAEGLEAYDPDSSTLLIATEDVETSTPTTILRRGFRINPNPNYAAHISPSAPSAVPSRSSAVGVSGNLFGTPPPAPQTPLQNSYMGASSSLQQQQSQTQTQQQNVLPPFHRRESTPLRPSTPGTRQPQYRASMGGVNSTSTSTATGRTSTSTSTGTGDGGNLGIYTHANSPLKKASSMYDIHRGGGRGDGAGVGGRGMGTPRNGMQAAAWEVAGDRERERERVRRRGI